MTVTIMYSCKGCGLRDVPLEVAERGPDQDVVVWVEFVRIGVSVDHTILSPQCAHPTVDLKIPLPPGDVRIGDPTKH